MATTAVSVLENKDDGEMHQGSLRILRGPDPLIHFWIPQKLSITPPVTKKDFLIVGDGLENQHTNATPILDKYGFTASFLVTCNFVGLKSLMSW